MQRSQIGFESSFARHLVAEQRKAVLAAIAAKIDEDATLGDVLDAAESLGWGEHLGSFSLAELAGALLPAASADEVGESSDAELDAMTDDDEALDEETDAFDEEDEDVDEEDEDEEDEEDEEEEEVEVAPRKGRGAKKKAVAAGRGKKAAKQKPVAKKKAGAKAAPARGKAAKAVPTSKKKGAKAMPAKAVPAKPVPAKPMVGKKKAKVATKGGSAFLKSAKLKALMRKVDVDDRMSLEEAAEILVPVVGELGETTMQDLETFTQIGRRKLRFHIGQLVKHGYLERHGMGRGTFYTVVEE